MVVLAREKFLIVIFRGNIFQGKTNKNQTSDIRGEALPVIVCEVGEGDLAGLTWFELLQLISEPAYP